MNEYERLLVLLAANKIRFVTVGGFACAFNGLIRATEDVDILIDDAPSNVHLLLKVLSTYGEGFAKELSEGDFTDEEGAIRIVERFPIDVFVRMSGLKYADFQNEIRHIRIEEHEVPFVSREALIRLKESSLRDIDKSDVIQLRQLSK